MFTKVFRTHCLLSRMSQGYYYVLFGYVIERFAGKLFEIGTLNLKVIRF